jgi:hypothetical protein
MNIIIGFISIVLYCDVKWREVPANGTATVTPGNNNLYLLEVWERVTVFCRKIKNLDV